MFNTDDVQDASISGALGAPAEAVAGRWLVAIVMVGAGDDGHQLLGTSRP